MRVHGYSEQNHASSPLSCPLPSRPLRPGPARPTAPRPWPVVGAVARSRGAPPPPAAGAEREAQRVRIPGKCCRYITCSSRLL